MTNKLTIFKALTLFLTTAQSSIANTTDILSVAQNGFHKAVEGHSPTSPTHKKWTIMVYIAADNDLFYFAWNNIRQLAQGANPHVNIIVYLNEPGAHKKTQFYLIEKNKAILLNKDNQEKLDSGDPQTLIDFCSWTIKNFPADDYFLDLWNHGTGIADGRYKAINPTTLFTFNPSTLMLELDRDIRYLDFIDQVQQDKAQRGICFDDSFKSYLSCQDLELALATISRDALQGKRLSIIGMDACLMAMIEVANICKKYAHIMVASEEVELGQGWRYDKVLESFSRGPVGKEDFAKQIVNSYYDTYCNMTSDFTLSAINLDHVTALEYNVNEVSMLLLECLQHQRGQSVKYIIRQCRRNICFEEPSYVDLCSLYRKLLQSIDKFNMQGGEQLIAQLKATLQEGIRLISNSVIANTCGSNLGHAQGLSIYFPEQQIISSYQRTEFAQTNQWYNFISHYIML